VGSITAEGDVTEVEYIFTRLREVVEGAYTGRLITIPNSAFMSGSISVRNIALSPPCIRDEITFTIAYENDLQYLKKIMMKVAEDVLKVGSDVKLLENLEVFFEPAEGGWIAAGLRYLVDLKSRMKVKSELTGKILEAFNKEPKPKDGEKSEVSWIIR
ncbi:mechanosensitive ion channel family protein, partial [Candidatus Bathyarchaeota archaeon]|nr:mechanosensitive ion channel family protein [Candidatus Bathyarchaeota archaeon]